MFGIRGPHRAVFRAACMVCWLSPWMDLGAADVEFNRDIRPILSDKCFACHGPDEEQRQTELRLDTQQGALEDLGGYQAVKPGSPAQSELVRRVLADGDDVMPPREHPKQLSDREKMLLRAWIEQGAEWQAHWAYEPPSRAALPEVRTADWPMNWIDLWVLSQLEREQMQPSPEADRVTLLRRLHFDLIGLPPTPQELQDYLADPSPQAYEVAVDRLLKSPHFGERMAMYWLDLVRYADTVGYHGDQDVSVSPYRDYVIQAFNDNMRFDQFTREQLAGDLLSEPSRDQLIASGYNKLGMMSAEGGVQPEEYLAKYAADRVRNASTVWLGSTLGCAECHDHKFDPFSTRDFYQFAAFFADIKERGLYSGANRDGNWGPQIDVPDHQLAQLLIPVDERIAAAQKALDSAVTKAQPQQLEWECRRRQELSQWVPLEAQAAVALHGTRLKTQADHSILATGKNPNQNTYTLTFDAAPMPMARLRIEVLPHKDLPQQGPGRAGNGNFVISEVRVLNGVGDSAPAVAIRAARASIEQADGKENPYRKWAAEAAVDDDIHGSSWGWAILPGVGQPQILEIELAGPLQTDGFQVVIEQNHTNPKHTLGHFRLWGTTEPSVETPAGGLELSVLPDEVAGALRVGRTERNLPQQSAIDNHYRKVAPQLAPEREELAAAERDRQALVEQHTRTSLITVSVAPREMRVLHRGNWMDKSGPVVTPAVPQFLPSFDAEIDRRPNRLDLAEWLTSRRNPLTARVFVNRLWKLYFGAGLSKVLDDVGSQGEVPSHPELLDSLAVDFMESGWDVKRMIKLIVMSSTYRQSSLMRPDLEQRDPYNRLLARQSRFRLDAELIRDNALAVSGLLVTDMGGRSVKPYQPAGLYRHLNFPTRTYQADTDRNQYRRGVYTHWQRQFLHPAMQAFDAPAREECTAERPRSNTPLAALVLLNDPSYVEASRRLAENVLLDGGDTTRDRLDWMMKRGLSRLPRPSERAIFERLLDAELANYQADPDAAEQLLDVGLARVDPRLEIHELAAWTSVARALLNMHEMVTRN